MMGRRTIAFAICCTLSCAPTSMLAQTKSQQDIVQAASKSYYNLPKEGLLEFQCVAVPDWQVTLAAELHTEIAPDHPAIKMLNGVHFWLSLDQQGSPKLTHKLDSPSADPKTQEGINQTVSGVEQVLSGFSQSVSPFLFTSMLPKPGDKYSFETRGNQHFLAFKEGSSDVSLTLREDLTVSEAKVVSSDLTATMRPQFSKTDKGFLLVKIDSDYKLPGDASATTVVMDIEYANVQGFQLPSKLSMDTRSGDATHKMVIAFTDYEVKKKN